MKHDRSVLNFIQDSDLALLPILLFYQKTDVNLKLIVIDSDV